MCFHAFSFFLSLFPLNVFSYISTANIHRMLWANVKWAGDDGHQSEESTHDGEGLEGSSTSVVVLSLFHSLFPTSSSLLSAHLISIDSRGQTSNGRATNGTNSLGDGKRSVGWIVSFSSSLISSKQRLTSLLAQLSFLDCGRISAGQATWVKNQDGHWKVGRIVCHGPMVLARMSVVFLSFSLPVSSFFLSSWLMLLACGWVSRGRWWRSKSKSESSNR